jgi:hypothetical protein
MARSFLALVAFLQGVIGVVGISSKSNAQDSSAEKETGFVQLFDGKSMDGWKVNENQGSWKVQDGCLVCNGERSHIFYVGDEKPYKNFHFKVEVKTETNSNAGIYFHTKYQDSGWL